LKGFVRRQAWVLSSRLAPDHTRQSPASGRTTSPGTREIGIFSRILTSLATKALNGVDDFFFESDLVEPESPFWANRLRPLIKVLQDCGRFTPSRVLLVSSLNEALCLGWLQKVHSDRIIIGPTPLSEGPDTLGVPARILDNGPLGTLAVAKELPDEEFESEGGSMVG